MQRRTKIVATLGPACEDIRTLRDMVAAGMDVARLSLAHDPLEVTLGRLERIRRVAELEGRFVGALADLPGPKIRAAPFPDGGVLLADGSHVELVPSVEHDTSNETRVAVDHPRLLEELEPDDVIALGDGAVRLVVTGIASGHADGQVVAGGWAQGRPGVALPPSRFSMPSPTSEDLEKLQALVEADIDAVAISFVRSPSDIDRARAVAGADGPMLVAKIETREAIDVIEEIIAVSDGVMVARGDLGIRCAAEDVPHHQKHIIRTCVAYAKPVITATQMLESMVRSPVPTRAEVSDVANAVFDGSSALMLSGETAIGHDPVGTIRTMARIAVRAERDFDYLGWGRSLGRQQVRGELAGRGRPDEITAAISAAAWRAAAEADVAAIVACTNWGGTPRAIARFRPQMPIVAATPNPRTARQLAMAWGITPAVTDRHGTTDDIVWFAVKAAAELGVVRTGDLIAVLVGSPSGPDQVTDTLRLVRVR